MTIDQWRRDPDLVAKSAAILRDPILQQMLAIVAAAGPASRPVQLHAQNETNVAVAYGECLNHQRVFEQLASFATPAVDARQVVESKFLPTATP